MEDHPFTPIGSDATNRWRLTGKIVSKQLMQQSRKSLLIQFSVTMSNMLREADASRGLMSVGGFGFCRPIGRTGTGNYTNDLVTVMCVFVIFTPSAVFVSFHLLVCSFVSQRRG